MAHGEAPEAEGGFRGEPRGEHGGEGEPGTQLSMDAIAQNGAPRAPTGPPKASLGGQCGL